MANRLKQEKSPYLMQHGENPVDWYPWCEEAFRKAAKEEKAVFLSIGYSHLPLVPRDGSMFLLILIQSKTHSPGYNPPEKA